MKENTYNGWTNYQTWVVKLWLDNDSGWDWDDELDNFDSVYDFYNYLEELHDEWAPTITGVFADLLSHALGVVDWYEIAESIAEDAGRLGEDGEIMEAGWDEEDEDEGEGDE